MPHNAVYSTPGTHGVCPAVCRSGDDYVFHARFFLYDTRPCVHLCVDLIKSSNEARRAVEGALFVSRTV